ncbi:hypothetical protein ACUNV4_08900 [Granulosicoccus sp. 3-233]|uniref:hypothetical protein n=1 Tax=Granulosicoccus sp. 3-233 TaxID=3417969 RepID=UPI003D358E0B
MNYWQEFLQFEYAHEILMAVGGLLVFVGVLQIVRSSLKMLFWVVIAGIGGITASYGMQQGSITIPGMEKLRGANLDTIASNIDTDVLEFLCQKIDTTQQCPETTLP